MVVINTRLEDELLDKFDMLCARDKRSRAFKLKQSVESFVHKFEEQHGEIAIDSAVLDTFRKQYNRKRTG